ncbi:Lrp/AsnC family transcriptional regulator [Pseudemcibacter aquimaris]|uniref:Lrp/AsnC family transcriptional regulator n=1 Tax=Pseudemcibacter aquimaris TaxID=2857064 RepID=UPI002010EBFC|nr:Lrp/AsnC family transcriptional regulator [Pseudemcibacter aquimaris]MCC3861215.1 Lrp/AsnC family transcriptional regulator [Pseudemcibacter aquimaris]WDU57990.1 Lrp/AsnC family transcriptional regulator [Pseudemcibacter aquimaris]
MDEIDKKITRLIQKNGRLSSAEIAKAVGVSVSTANERVRKLEKNGYIQEWRAVMNARKVGANLAALILVDMDYDGEKEATEKLAKFPEIQEIHHISGARSYLIKIRVSDTDALQSFLSQKVKPLKAITRTESFIILDTVKETSEVIIT